MARIWVCTGQDAVACTIPSPASLATPPQKSARLCNVGIAQRPWFGEGHPYRLTLGWPTLALWDAQEAVSTNALVCSSDLNNRVLACGEETGLVKLEKIHWTAGRPWLNYPSSKLLGLLLRTYPR